MSSTSLIRGRAPAVAASGNHRCSRCHCYIARAISAPLSPKPSPAERLWLPRLPVLSSHTAEDKAPDPSTRRTRILPT